MFVMVWGAGCSYSVCFHLTESGLCNSSSFFPIYFVFWFHCTHKISSFQLLMKVNHAGGRCCHWGPPGVVLLTFFVIPKTTKYLPAYHTNKRHDAMHKTHNLVWQQLMSPHSKWIETSADDTCIIWLHNMLENALVLKKTKKKKKKIS